MTLSSDLRDKNSLSVLAISLKQCRVPKTLNWELAATNRRTSDIDIAAYRRSVLYSRFPAQFVNLCSDVHENVRGHNAVIAVPKRDLIKVRFFKFVVLLGHIGKQMTAWHNVQAVLAIVKTGGSLGVFGCWRLP